MNPAYGAARLASIVRAPKWGGGVHRDHARELLRCDRRELNAAIAIAYRRRSVDVCWNFVVAPPTAAAEERAA